MSYEEKGRAVLGNDGFVRWETLRKVERQRVWDHMRQVARIQFNEGTLPAWFNTAWLDIKEAPVNAFWREQGVSVYQNDDQWLSPDMDPGDGNGFAGGGGSSWGGGGFRWWREEDPYWPMRDWGDHPVRWWAFIFAAVLAVGGVTAYAQSGIAESLWWGFGLSSSLAVCAMGMSDMTHDWLGHLCVKGAWITCALLAVREYYWGWRHLRRDGRQHSPSLLSSGWAAVAMCGLLMWTGMSGLEGYALPDNPGSVFKSPSVAHKSRVWQQWGYGDVYMK